MPERIAQYCINHLDLQNATLGEEYYYLSLPFCIIDAVYSLAAKYVSTRNTVLRFCNFKGLNRLRQHGSPYTDMVNQYSVREFDEFLSGYNNYPRIASEVFNNRQRTATRNGILKAEAVHRFARALSNYDVKYFQDIPNVIGSNEFDLEIRAIPGQTYGTSLKYFFMLAGEENMIKPDRMIIRFLRRIIGNEANQQNAHAWLSQALQILNGEHPTLTLRKLDHEIWKYEKSMVRV